MVSVFAGMAKLLLQPQHLPTAPVGKHQHNEGHSAFWEGDWAQTNTAQNTA